ncbi:MAG: Hpt domain-containing protein [Bdellovibrionales bacterium]
MDVVDLTNLREAIDGDKELEQELFDEFISSSKVLIIALEQHCAGNSDNEAWRKAAHALKGISVNLGADHLGTLSKDAQEGFEAASPEKNTWLSQIKAEHEKVLQFLSEQT